MDLSNLKPTLVKKHCKKAFDYVQPYASFFFVYDAEIICKTASLYVAFCFGPTNNHITPSLNAMWHM